ncbi:recombinase family protein [Umezawaea tangerina]|uniref:DNA invertase Pin-like site-specific DNA recombinase n=1 Tax=Umezawaea tangerina TaxID=84725 RepID=A0A2T0T4B3_9PSEU|nr:recombinase family protein [Umezawaea tangerina]PRY40525.1 DNA invertase Pin-like site-specific DNA recombinase [Umezawaea tangerina]
MDEDILNQELALHVTGIKRTKRAVLYLRVSTSGQVNTDYNPEGISIPAQREAGTRKADSLDAGVVREFVEPGRTATSIDKRPVFQEMIAWVKEQKDIDYIIVYHFNRVFRNSVDAAITKRDLHKVGTRIVSTVLDMGEGPESAMVESIIHAVDQYQSQASGADIRYKMGQKAKNGGTLGPAPLGYLNVREAKPEGGEIRTVMIDPERGPLVRKGIELFATGQYIAQDALDHVTTAGLRTRGTRRTSPKELSLSQFYEILSDRYYIGKVNYDDVEYPGRHQALITEETFDRVQRVLALRGGGGTRERVHHHWLKGLLWCHRCGHRMVIMRGKGNGGVYFYFFCRGRQKHLCDLPYLGMADVEAAVDKHLGTVRLRDDFQAAVRRQLDEAVLIEQGAISGLKKRLGARLDELDTKEDNLLELLGDPDWPRAKIKSKLAGIERERAEIQAQIADTTSKLEAGRQFFGAALDLLADPQGFYRRGSDTVKRAITKVMFHKLHLDAEQIMGHDLTDGLAGLVEAGGAGGQLRNSKSTSVPGDGGAFDLVTDAVLLDVVQGDNGSSKTALVDDTGIEPVTPTVST